MAITFLQEKSRQKHLFLILVLVIFGIILIVWWGFFRGNEKIPSGLVPTFLTPKEISIDWEVLKNPQLDELEVFEEISPLSGESGRENPFTPY
jgi:hypothetical protein